MKSELYELNGEARTLKEWALHVGLRYKTLWARVRKGMPLERALSREVERRKPPRDPSRTLTKECKNCGVTFTIPKCHDWRENCCSSECKTAYRKTQSAVLRSVRTRICQHCGSQFVAKKSQLESASGARFCSVACCKAGNPLAKTIHRPEARLKAQETLRRKRATGELVYRRGKEHHQWKGGPQASQKRRIESGASAAARRRYLQENPHKQREWSSKRASQRRTGRLPYGTVPKLGNAQRWRCAVCRTGIRNAYHLDHIMPLARGGKHEPANLQLLCPSCNVRKSAKHPIDFMQERGFLL